MGRSEDLVKLQRKIAAYRQLQHDTTAQLYNVAGALLVPEERSLDAILRQVVGGRSREEIGVVRISRQRVQIGKVSP
jgi:hypothetical protein